MTQRKATPDLVSQVLAGKPAAGIPATPQDSGDMVRVNFFLPSAWKRTLTEHFKAQGLDLSNGIRLALARFMTEEGLK